MSSATFIKSYLDRHGKQRTYYRHGKIKRVLPDQSDPDFAGVYAAIRASDYLLSAMYDRSPTAKKAARFELCLRRVLDSTAKRAKSRGRDYDLDLEWFAAQIASQRYRCALTGLDFSYKRAEDTLRNPYAPSIDRINNRRGYTRDNVRIVLVSVNMAINEWGENHFAVIARAYAAATEWQPTPTHRRAVIERDG